MYINRTNSLDAVKIPNWSWGVFLDYTIDALSSFSIDSYPIPDEFLCKEETFLVKSVSSKVQIATWACRTNKIRQARAACLYAQKSASVLNFVINPFHYYDLPFFGADFVTLPSGHLLALDLQPALKMDLIHTQNIWSRLLPLHDKWQSMLPNGGEIPSEAKDFFSPGFLWTRIPLGDHGDTLIAEVIKPAYQEYLSLYIELLKEAEKVSNKRSLKILDGQRRYVNYRSSKDPARGMLKRFFGDSWTERYINGVLFDL